MSEVWTYEFTRNAVRALRRLPRSDGEVAEGCPMRRYAIILDYDADVDAYAVSVPALPGCFTQGKTGEQAVERAREAIQLHIEGLISDGEAVPDDSIDIRLLTVDVPELAITS